MEDKPSRATQKGEVIAVAFSEFQLNLIETVLKQEKIADCLDVLFYNKSRISQRKIKDIAKKTIPFAPDGVGLRKFFKWYRVASKIRKIIPSKSKKCLLVWSLSHPISRSLAFNYDFERIIMIEDGVANYVPDRYIYRTLKDKIVLAMYRLVFSNFHSLSKEKPDHETFLLLNEYSKVKGSRQLSKSLFWQGLCSHSTSLDKAHTDILLIPPSFEIMGNFSADIERLITIVERIARDFLKDRNEIHLYCHPISDPAVNEKRLNMISREFPSLTFALVENREVSFQNMMTRFPNGSEVNIYSEASSAVYLALTIPNLKVNAYVFRARHDEMSSKRSKCFEGYLDTLLRLGAKEM